ncbi:MAG: ECF transporter S component, partial [Bifidobacteriaceae bacterium]|nr:ECF transporter S component [Bifidobacteriaceae bacterium]
IAAGIWLLDDRRYYLVATAILVYSLIPFGLVFERRRPPARELVILAVMTAIAVASRAAFFMLPHFKPMAAVVIITGAALGPEAGFLVGAMAAFTSNFLFGQGPWTPWQMFGFGVVGFAAGLVLRPGRLPPRPLPMALFGGLAVFAVYGPIVDTSALVTFYARPTMELALATYAAGVPVNLIHAGATVLFLLALARPMVLKLRRVQAKYGLATRAEAADESAD